MKKEIIILVALFISLIPIVAAQAEYRDNYNILFLNFLDMATNSLNVTGNFILESYPTCVLKSYANGTIYCGTDNVGGGGTSLWQVIGEWMSGNETAGGSQKINITDINTTTLNVSGTASIGEADITGDASIGGDANISGDADITGNATIDGDVNAGTYRRNETINSYFFIDDNGVQRFYAE